MTSPGLSHDSSGQSRVAVVSPGLVAMRRFTISHPGHALVRRSVRRRGAVALATPSPHVPCHPVPREALCVSGDSPGGAGAFAHRCGTRGTEPWSDGGGFGRSVPFALCHSCLCALLRGVGSVPLSLSSEQPF